MSQTFTYDKNVKNGGSRRDIPAFRRLYQSALPEGTIISKIIGIDNVGFIVHHPNASDADCVFSSQMINMCNSNNLDTKLTRDLALKCEIFLVDVPELIYNKPIEEIVNEIKKISDKIINVTKHSGSARKYLILTAKCATSRNDILANCSFNLFDHIITSELPILKSRNNPNTSAPDPSPQLNHDRTRPRTSQRSLPPSGQAWSTGRPNNSAPPPPPSNDPDFIHWPALGNRTHAVSKLHHNDKITYSATTAVIIAERLLEGYEKPFELIAAINETLAYNGIPTVEIPPNQIMMSRNLFDKKSLSSNHIHSHYGPPIIPTHDITQIQPNSTSDPTNHTSTNPSLTPLTPTSFSPPPGPAPPNTVLPSSSTASTIPSSSPPSIDHPASAPPPQSLVEPTAAPTSPTQTPLPSDPDTIPNSSPPHSTCSPSLNVTTTTSTTSSHNEPIPTITTQTPPTYALRSFHNSSLNSASQSACN